MFDVLFGRLHGIVVNPQDQAAMSQQEIAAWQLYKHMPEARRTETSFYQWMEDVRRVWAASLPDRFASFCQRLEAAQLKRKA